MNITWSQKILTELYREGVRDLIFCAGARNSPLVAVISKTEGFKLHSFFEERSAAFYALGVARRTGRPVAVITTSGTAAAELLPAVVEAFHTGVPLVLVTADRPRRLRGTGAPQAIDQTGLFAKFVAKEFDLEAGEIFSLEDWNGRAPVHINVCLDEPLIDREPDALTLSEGDDSHSSFAGVSSFQNTTGSEWGVLKLVKFLRGEGLLLTVVGTLETEAERSAVSSFLKLINMPVYLEGTSGLREDESLSEIALRSGEKVLSWALREGLISRVLRIGSVPTARIWRDLDMPGASADVLSLTSLPFAGLGRGELLCADIARILEGVVAGVYSPETRDPKLQTQIARLIEKDRAGESELEKLLVSEPKAEPSLVRALSEVIPADALIYVGNSLPIREWDLVSQRNKKFHVEANRGVNGIDGQISTYIGLAREGVENWAFIGDLTALYDLVGPWAFGARGEELKLRLVIMNNGGGKIFSRIFRNPNFENRHELGFESWAKMWGFEYQRWTSVPQKLEGSSRMIIEIVPDEDATTQFWNRYDKFWS